MGNAPSAPPPKTRAPRAVDTPDKERRQVYREQAGPRSHITNDIRRLVRAKIAGELRSRPVTRQDIDEIRMVLLSLAPQCPADSPGGACSLPGPIHDGLVIVESSEGRTFTLHEVAVLHAIITDDAEIVNPAPQPHKFIANRAKFGSTCECHSASCSECAAAAFAPPQFLKEPWMRHNLTNVSEQK